MSSDPRQDMLDWLNHIQRLDRAYRAAVKAKDLHPDGEADAEHLREKCYRAAVTLQKMLEEQGRNMN